MKLTQFIIYIVPVCLLTMIGCADNQYDTLDEVDHVRHPFTLTTELSGFDGEDPTRANLVGDDFLDGDLIRLKIICPFSKDSEYGESTNGVTTDNSFVLKRSGRAWTRVVSADGFDLDGDYVPSGSADLFGGSYYVEAQQTPYVYTANTWSEEKYFVSNKKVYDQYSSVFHADQSKLRNYLASDVLWAQTYMQTGCWNIHLAFEHKMACIDITVPGVTANAVVTLEKMPDIDQAEVIVGDYYAHKAKNCHSFGYREKTSCAYEYNGRVIGVASVNDLLGHIVIHPFSGGPNPIGGLNDSYQGSVVPNTATYRAYCVTKGHYRLIVPPCVLEEDAVFWVRDSVERFSKPLTNRTFVEGQLYPVTLQTN